MPTLTFERTGEPFVSTRQLEESFYRELASDAEEAFSHMKVMFGSDVDDEVRNAVLTAQAFGDSVLVNVSGVAALQNDVDRALDGLVDLDSVLFEGDALDAPGTLDAAGLRDTVSSALRQSLMNLEDLVRRARAQTY